MSRFSLSAVIAAASFSFPSCGQILVGELFVEPQSPRVNETVRVVTAPTTGCGRAFTRELTTAMVNNRITITIPINEGPCGVPPPTPTLHIPIGQLPPGSYEVEVIRKLEHQQGRLDSLGVRTFTVSPRNPSDPIANYTDLWWNPSESGWGLNIIQHPSNTIFATWFSYANDGRQEWYFVSDGSWSATDNTGRIAPNTFSGSLYRTSGPSSGAFDPSHVTRTLVGTARFDFNGWNSLLMTLSIDGRTIQKQLQRQSF